MYNWTSMGRLLPPKKTLLSAPVRVRGIDPPFLEPFLELPFRHSSLGQGRPRFSSPWAMPKKILSPDPILKLTRGFFPVKICVWYMEWRILKALTLLLDLEVLLSPEFLCHKHFWGEYIPVAIANTCMACLDVFLFQMMSIIYSLFFFPPLGWCLWKDSLVMMMFSRYSTHMFQTQHVGTCWSTLLHLTLQ